MKKLGLLIALVTATLIAVGVSFAGEEHEIKYLVKVALDDDVEVIDIELDDMEVGEARQFFTDSGKEVLVTRTEEGHKLEVDGREIALGMHGALHEHHGAHVGIHKCDKCKKGEKGHCCEGASKIVIHKKGGEDGETEATADVFVMVGDDEGRHIEHFGEHHERVEVLMDHPNVLDHLLESGVLDELDPEARQKIIDTLKEIEPEEGKVIRLKTKRIVVDEEDEDS